jgi:hypothetical protein
MNERK